MCLCAIKGKPNLHSRRTGHDGASGQIRGDTVGPKIDRILSLVVIQSWLLVNIDTEMLQCFKLMKAVLIILGIFISICI